MLKKILLSGYLVLVMGLVVIYWAKMGEPNIKQPIQFNHLKHKEIAECETCHKYIKELTFASLPTQEDCAACHEDLITDSPEEKKLHQYIEKGQDIPWKRLYRKPPHVYFSHKRHVALGGLECEPCHGDMGSQPTPPRKPIVALKMNDCLACHKSSGVKTDCVTCHR
jgi:hypothetical protein